MLLAEDTHLFPCKCNDYVDTDGFGLCQKRDKRFDGAFSCFVNYPSSCIDLQEFPESKGKQISAVACEDKNEGDSCFVLSNYLKN